MASYSSQAALADTFMQSSDADANKGDETKLNIGDHPDPAAIIQWSLLKFDLSSIPVGSMISAAALSLWMYAENSNSNVTVGIYRCKRVWTELGCTWNKYDGSNAWAAAGGWHADDVDQTSMGDLAHTTTESTGEKQWELDEGGGDYSKLEAMVGDSPIFTNNGFYIYHGDASNSMYSYRSKEYATAEERPKLVITYTYKPNPSIIVAALAVIEPSIGTYDTRFKLRARKRDTALTARVRNE